MTSMSKFKSIYIKVRPSENCYIKPSEKILDHIFFYIDFFFCNRFYNEKFFTIRKNEELLDSSSFYSVLERRIINVILRWILWFTNENFYNWKENFRLPFLRL